jgi:hypothetical protein
MKKPAAVLIFFICFLCGHSQKIQTIVPKQVVAGNAFQIQYIIENPSSLAGIHAPQFENFQLVSGPNYYKGSSLINGKTQPIENITYTVVPLKTGIIKINPLTVQFTAGNEESSDEVTLNVIPQPKASFNSVSTYTDINLYAPPSKTDLDKLIEANLFVTAEVDKRICFLGEAITATFKLYSRLQSTSEVLNAPSLYGFSVMDMFDINEAHQAVETINGKVFNTSVLRKLQLYPSQTGKLTIDEMQLQNSIEFDDTATGNKIKVEKLLASNPIGIVVKPLPLKQPGGYTGAVGRFEISANLEKSEMEANDQGKFILIIKGKGNFIQLGPPLINWPKELDVFDPVVSDELNKNAVPTEGSRKYVFSFTTDRVDSYLIPPIAFSFFDPSVYQYKEVKTDSIKLEIVPSTKSDKNKKHSSHKVESVKTWAPALSLAAIAILIFVLYGRSKKRKQASSIQTYKTSYHQKFNELFSQQLTDKELGFQIQKLLIEASREERISIEQKQEAQSIQDDCRLLIYSDVNTASKREEVQKNSEAFFKELQF